MLIKTIHPLQRCQLKFSSSEKGVFEGYAATFNTNDAVNDTILPGAFDKSLASGDVIKMFVNHDQYAVPVGDWDLNVDAKGLFAKGKVDLNHKDGPTVYSALKRKAMDGLSQGFTLTKKDYEMKEGFDDEWYGGNRNIKNVSLKEISICNFPCENQARIHAVKSEIEGLESLKDCEHYLRDVCGLSRSMAKTMVSQMRNFIQCDAVDGKAQITQLVGAEVLTTINAIHKRFK